MTLQSEVTEWAQSVFGRSSTRAKVLHLWEELEETFAELNSDVHTSAARVELADCGLILMHLASSLNVVLPEPSRDLADLLRWKLAVCKLRKWGAPDSDGVVRHVDEVKNSSAEST